MTDNELVQEAIENEPLYGSLFSLKDVQLTDDEKAAKDADAKKEEVKAEPEQTPEAEAPAEEKAENNVVKVADFAEAKEYLMEHYGYKSAQLRSQKSITEAAETHNITFEYA